MKKTTIEVRPMTLTFLQLNIEAGKFIDEIISFVKENDIDVLQFQEIAGGSLQKSSNDCFTTLQTQLDYQAILTKVLETKDGSYFGNATFCKKSFSLTEKQVVWLWPFTVYDEFPKSDWSDVPRNALHTELTVDDKKIQLINCHLAWGPTPKDEPYKIDQGNILIDYVKQLPHPFILSGDFNLTAESKVVQGLNQIARNLSVENNLKNTMNHRTHRVKDLPDLAVDFIYTSHDLSVRKFQLIDSLDLSDHFGLLMKLEI